MRKPWIPSVNSEKHFLSSSIHTCNVSFHHLLTLKFNSQPVAAFPRGINHLSRPLRKIEVRSNGWFKRSHTCKFMCRFWTVLFVSFFQVHWMLYFYWVLILRAMWFWKAAFIHVYDCGLHLLSWDGNLIICINMITS